MYVEHCLPGIPPIPNLLVNCSTSGEISCSCNDDVVVMEIVFADRCCFTFEEQLTNNVVGRYFCVYVWPTKLGWG